MEKKILEKLVKINTITKNSNLKLIIFCAKKFEEYGYKIVLIKAGDKANLFAYKKLKGSRLILSAHTDTVPPGVGWDTDPLCLVEKENKYFGLGVCDMKSFIAIMLDIAKNIENEKLAFLLTFNEETDFAGAKLVDSSIISSDDMVVIGEPTNNKVISGNKGVLALRAIVKGVAGHGSNPSSGVSAIEKAAVFICQLKEKFKGIEQDQNSSFANPLPTFNFGTIQGGDAINKIAANVMIDFEFRITSDAQKKRILGLINDIVDENCIDVEFEELLNLSAHLADSGALKGIQTYDIEIGSGESYCTEANILNALTKKVLVFGPGDPSQAHSSNEYITMSQLNQYEKLLLKFIKDMK